MCSRARRARASIKLLTFFFNKSFRALSVHGSQFTDETPRTGGTDKRSLSVVPRSLPFISRTSTQRLSVPPSAGCQSSVACCPLLVGGCLSPADRSRFTVHRQLITVFSILSPVFCLLSSYFFLNTLLSPILMVSCVMSKYSRRGIVYFLEAPVISLNWGVSISPFSLSTATSLSFSSSITFL
jgi:hypothetical protein